MGGRLRVPGNFTQFAPGKTLAELQATYMVSQKILVRWKQETGVMGAYRRVNTPMPEGFAAALLKHGIRGTAALFDLPVGRVEHWARFHKLPFKTNKALPVPDDFASMARNMSQTQLSAHYNVGQRVVKRWVDDGPPEWAVWIAAAAQERRKESGRLSRSRQTRQHVTQPAFVLKQVGPVRDQVAPISEADQAMRWLQRKGPCYPLRIYGKNLPGYRFAGRLWQDDELIAEARRRGWQADAWPVAA